MGAGVSGARAPAISAGLGRRLLALFYDALLLAALIFLSSLPFMMLAHEADRAVTRPLFQLYLLAVSASYFVGQWSSSGQTLAMKTWQVRLVTRECNRLSPQRAALRFLFAVPGALLLGVGFLWALVDSKKLFLHDRLAGTKIVQC